MAGKSLNLTKEEMKQELLKCGKDPVYFIRNYVKISHPIRGVIPFKTYKFQEDVLRDYVNYRFNIILKGRQLGMSTLTAAYCVWLMMFHRSKEILVVATKFKTAANLVKKVKAMIRKLPAWIRISNIKVDNHTNFSLENESQIQASTTSADAGRSESLSLLVLDEAAHIEKMEEMWKALGPTLSTGGRCIALSCVTKDTFVFSKNGLQTIEDFIPNEGKEGGYVVGEYEILGREKTRKGNLFLNNGKAKTRKIITKYSELEGSYKHKVWSFKDNKYGWFKFADLEIGDYIAIQYGNEIWGNDDDVSDFVPSNSVNNKNIFNIKKINPDLSYILGLFLSEGSSYWCKNKDGKKIGFNFDISCGDDVKEYLNKLGFYVYRKNINYRISSKTFGEFLEYLGFDLSLKAKQKYIPKRLLRMSRNNIIALLRGIFDGDGWSRKDRGEVGIGLSSLKMIKQIRMMLLNFGILSEYKHHVTKPTKIVKVFSNQYRILLNKTDSKIFYEKIGFNFERKQINKNILLNYNLDRSSPNDIIPNSICLMKEMQKHLSFGTYTLNKRCGLNINGVLNKSKHYKTKNISRKNCLKMFALTKEVINPLWRKEIEKLISENIVWVPIKDILENEKEVYDFSLPENESDFWCHSVIYNGMLGHNSPNGTGNWFHKIYSEAEQELNDFNAVKLMWDVHPERDQEWFLKETKNMSKKDVQQEHMCVKAGTKIITPTGYKEIEKINIGDLVLTHNGRFRKTIKLYKNNVKKLDMVSINCPMSRKYFVFMTKNHPILTLNEKNSNIYAFIKSNMVEENWSSYNSLNERGMINSSPPKFLNAMFPVLDENVFTNEIREIDLSKYDYSTIIDKNYVRYFRQKNDNTRRIIPINYNLGKIIGLYVSEGNKNQNRVQFSFHSEEKYLMNFIKFFCEENGMNYNKYERNYSNCSVIFVWNKFLSSIIDEFVEGTNCYNKLLKNEIYKTNKNFVKGIVDGIWLGDGYHNPKKKNVWLSASEKLIYQIRTLMTMFGLFTRISDNDYDCYPRNNKYLELNNVDGKKIYECTENGLDDVIKSRCKKYNNKWWGSVKFEELSGEEEIEVFNIEVEEDNSYVCENIVVHNCSFNLSGETVFDPEDIERMEQLTKDPIHRTGFDRNFWIWEQYDINASYLMVCDVARGDGADYSVFHIFKLETSEIVAEYQGKIPTDLFSNIINQSAREYGNCLVVVENNSIGHAVLKDLVDLEYPNLYYSTKGSHEYIEQFEAENRSDAVPGFTMSGKTRPLIIAKMEEMIRNKMVTIYSKRMLTEMKTFIWSNGKPESMRTYNDDLIVACAIGCWVQDTALKISKRDLEYKKSFLGAIKKTNKTFNSGISGMSTYKNVPGAEAHKTMMKQFSWMFPIRRG